jgi:hypothetical protein
VGALTAVCLLAGIVLLVSCFAVWRGWLGVHDLGKPMPVRYLDDDGNNDR